jgi:hypothetical protein
MDDTLLNGRLAFLEFRIRPLEKLVHLFADQFQKPIRYDSGQQHHGFRYLKPNVRHFCLLKAVRIVSALNAAIELARKGYAQEICVLIRTLAEYTTHIEFVLYSIDEFGNLGPEAENYIQAFFADYVRNRAADFKRAQVSQRTVNKKIGQTLNNAKPKDDSEFSGVDAEQLESNVYRTYSNYVHAKYPEVMDLYGGVPERFHMRGMKGTPKDDENIDIIDSIITTASLTFRLMIWKLDLYSVVEADTNLKAWLRTQQAN